MTTRPVTTSFALFLVACIALGGGCARVEKEKKTRGLEAAVTAYGNSLRWAYYDTALGYLHPSYRNASPEQLKNVRVTSYEVVQPPVLTDEAQTSAEQVVQIEYVLQDEQVVRTLADRQDWRYDPQTESWWLHSGAPVFR
jgi:hypothetical protein